MNPPIRQLSYDHPPRQDKEPDTFIDLREHFGVLIDNRWFIASIALVFSMLGLIYALLAKPVYESSILVQVEESAAGRSLPGDISSAFDLKSGASSEIEVLRSRMVLGRAVDSMRLDVNVQPKYFPLVGAGIARYNKELSTPGLFGYGGYAWGAELAEVSVFNVPEALEGSAFTLIAGGDGDYRLIQEDRRIEISGEVGKTVTVQSPLGSIELRVDRLEAKPGARFNLTRVPRIVAIENLQRAMKIAERGRLSGVISVAVEGPDPKRTTALLREIGREYIRQNEDRKSEAAEKTLALLDRQLPRLKKDLESAEATYNELRHKHGTIDLGEEGKALLQQSTFIQTRIFELRQRKGDLLVRYQDAHPLVEGIDQQIRSLERDIGAVVARIKKLPSIEQDVVRLSRDVQVNRDVYTAVLSTAQQLRLATSSKTGNVRLLDSPETPVRPIKPKRSLTVLLACALGLAIGSVAALMRKKVDSGLHFPDEVERLLGLTVCATIPHSDSGAKSLAQNTGSGRELALLSKDAYSDNVVESLLHFNAALPFTMAGARNNIIMITGPTPGVGKSYVSANFATVLGSMGKKVLLIDGDLRTGHLHQYFDRDRGYGLADIIHDEPSLDKAVAKEVAECLDFISTGSLPARPAHVLAHQNFGRILHVLSTRYDLILIDSAPVLAVSDALTVGLQAGTVFNVVRADHSTAWEIEETIKRLKQAGVSVTGTVFNDLKSELGRYSYGYGYSYGHGYGYGNRYGVVQQ